MSDNIQWEVTDTTKPVNVVSPTGEIGSIPYAKLADAVSSGFRLATGEELFKQQLIDKYGSDSGLALIAGLGRGITVGLSDYALGAMGGSEMKKRLSAYQELHPGPTALGEIAGVAIGSLASGGTSALARGISAPTRLVATTGQALGRAAEATLGKGIVSSGLALAGEGAIYGGLLEGSSQYLHEIPLDPERLFSAAASGALYSGILGAAMGGISGRQANIMDDAARGKADHGLLMGGINKADDWVIGGHLEKGNISSKTGRGMRFTVSSEDAMKKAAEAPEFIEDTYSRTRRVIKEEHDNLLRAGVQLQKEIKSVASGAIKDFPDGHFQTNVAGRVDGLAQEMINKSDELVGSQLAKDWDVPDAAKFRKNIESAYNKYQKTIYKSQEFGAPISVSQKEAVRAAWEFVEHLDEIGRNIETRLGGKIPKGHFSSLTSAVQKGDEAAALFGESGKLMKMADRLSKKSRDARLAFEKALMNGTKKGDGFGTSVDKKYLSWLEGKKGLRMLDDTEAGRAYKNYLQVHKELEEFAEEVSKNYGLSSEISNKIKTANKNLFGVDENLQDLKQSLSRLDMVNDVYRADKALGKQAGMGANLLRSGGAILGMTVGMMGMPLLGAGIGAAGLAAGSLYALKNSPATYMRASNAVHRFLVDRTRKTVTAVDRMGKEGLASHAPKNKKTPIQPGLSILAVAPLRAGDNRQKAFDKTYNKLAASVGQEDRMRAELFTKLGSNPQLATSVDEATQVAIRARNYLMGQAWSKALGINSSKFETAKFLQAAMGVKYPEKILDKALDGTLSLAEARAFREVYPTEYARVRTLVTQKIMDMTSKQQVLPRRTRLKMSLAFDLVLDKTLDVRYIADMASSRIPAEPQQPQQLSQSPQISNMYENKSEVISRGDNL